LSKKNRYMPGISTGLDALDRSCGGLGYGGGDATHHEVDCNTKKKAGKRRDEKKPKVGVARSALQ